jgi:hypothetical protein
MKYTLNTSKHQSQYWNGLKPLPAEINVMSYHQEMSEFELLSIICSLHGYVTALDLLTGSEPQTEKDDDITAVHTAFQMYLYPRMPLSKYNGSTDKRIKSSDIDKQIVPVDVNKNN